MHRDLMPGATRTRDRRSQRGLSLIEMLLALTIVAMLLGATMVAIDASFYAYASAAGSASTQTSTRLTVHRLLKLIRTSRAHDPVSAIAPQTWPDTMLDTLDTELQARRGVNRPSFDPNFPDGRAGSLVKSDYLYIIDPQGHHRLITYVKLKETNGGGRAVGELWLTTLPAGATEATSQPLLSGALKSTKDGSGDWRRAFTLHRRLDQDGVWVLERGSAELAVRPSDDTTLSIERTADYKAREPIELIASTVPRRLE